ncbi:hypothetical protein SteCoe_6154 [Stentor coeruleus]|uniref:RCC1-like domain-containing protein n=1 Tax=Stentor coeruleus TaxID=5963 RepID=A0A1R2CQS7_9CILI|nr:hypothetical protein SteCoe_6154 [Stentor coeruleus]
MQSNLISTECNSEFSHQGTLLIEDNPLYKGLYSYTKLSRFNNMNFDIIYKFPILGIPSTSPSSSSQDYYLPSSVNISKFLALLHERSPFNRGQHTEISQSFVENSPERGVPKNSINLNSFNSGSYSGDITPFNLAEEMEKNHISLTNSYISSALNTSSNPEKADISLNTKEMILNIHRNYAAQQDNELYLNSITPASSLALSQLQNSILSGPEVCFLDKSLCKDRLENSSYLEISAIENENKRLYNSINEEEAMNNDEICSINVKKTEEIMKRSDVFIAVRRGSEAENSVKNTEGLKRMPEMQVMDEDFLSSPDDEGPLMISTTRMFLNGETASKAKLLGPPARVRVIKEFSNKESIENTSHILTTSPEMHPPTNPHDIFSPLTKKLVFFESTSQSSCKILYATACCGFGSGLTIEYASNENETKAFPHCSDTKDIWNGLWDLETAKLMHKIQIEWISCGFEHMASVTNEGKVMTWGYGGSGCLGHGDTRSYKMPTLVNSIFQERFIYLECGGYHTIGISEEGEVWAWGRGDVNQLGIQFEKLIKDDVGHVALRPQKIKNCSKQNLSIKSVACGEAHTLLLDADGRIFAFGWAEYGQLGLCDNDIDQSGISKSICQVQSMAHKVIKISAGCLFSVCLTDMGQVFVWGNGDQGQLGLGNSMKNTSYPTLVSSLRHEFIIDVICSETSVICLTQSGNVYGWGRGIAGRFLDGGNYTLGSDIICFVPRKLQGVNIVQKYLIKNKPPADDFTKELMMKLMKLKNS